jgi:hypothetical protein
MRDVDDKTMMHSPDRADNLRSLEEHLNSAAYLTRALWLVMSSNDLSVEDKRDKDAHQELASVAADHASAARYAWYREDEKS